MQRAIQLIGVVFLMACTSLGSAQARCDEDRGASTMDKKKQTASTEAKPQRGPQRGTGGTDRGHEALPDEAAGSGLANDRAGAIPLGMPVTERELRELKRRAQEADESAEGTE